MPRSLNFSYIYFNYHACFHAPILCSLRAIMRWLTTRMLTKGEGFQPLFGCAQSYFSVYKERVGVVQLSTLSLYLPSVSLSLTPSLFLFFPSFFCSHAAARRQEQHEQTGFLSLAAFIHLPKTTPFPPIEIFFSLNQLMIASIQNCCNGGKHWPKHSLFCCHNVDSHASKSCDKPPSFSLILTHSHSLFSPKCHETIYCSVWYSVGLVVFHIQVQSWCKWEVVNEPSV